MLNNSLTIGLDEGTLGMKHTATKLWEEQGMLRYIKEIHFPHYNSDLKTGRPIVESSESDVDYWMKYAEDNDIETSLILNHSGYDRDLMSTLLNDFYIPRGLDSVILKDTDLMDYIGTYHPQLNIQGSCISYIDTVDGLAEEAKHGVTMHNPATWAIRDRSFIEAAHNQGYKQKHIFGEGCVRKCGSEKKHRALTANSKPGDSINMCVNSFTSLDKLLLSSWVTLTELRRMEDSIDMIKVPRGTVKDWRAFSTLLKRYNKGTEYNILEYFSIPIVYTLRKCYLSSSLFDDEFFDNTMVGNVDLDYLDFKTKEVRNSPKCRGMSYFDKHRG